MGKTEPVNGPFETHQGYGSHVPDDAVVFDGFVSHELLLLVVPSQSAVDEVGSPRDVVGIGGGKKSCYGRDVFGASQTPQGYLGQQWVEFCGIPQEIAVDLRRNGSRGDA